MLKIIFPPNCLNMCASIEVIVHLIWLDISTYTEGIKIINLSMQSIDM